MAPGRDRDVLPTSSWGPASQQMCGYCVIGLQPEGQTVPQRRCLKDKREDYSFRMWYWSVVWKSLRVLTRGTELKLFHPAAVCKLHPQQTMPGRRTSAPAAERDAACPGCAAPGKGGRRAVPGRGTQAILLHPPQPKASCFAAQRAAPCPRAADSGPGAERCRQDVFWLKVGWFGLDAAVG